eukprot:scaffold159066_cov28-Tisochrysis_lutea.AAC.2
MAPYTRIDPQHGHVGAGSAVELKVSGNEALHSGDLARACHMYTLGLDLLVGRKSTEELSASEWFSLDQSSEGVLSALLANRSFALLSQGDAAAAVDDAEHCCHARPGWAKAHLRLVAALQKGDAPHTQVLAALRRGLRACPTSMQLKEGLAKLQAQLELDAMAERGAARASGKTVVGESAKKSHYEDDQVDEAAVMAMQLEMTRRVADDLSDPRRFIAAGDLGAALALGAHGVEQDCVSAETYLRLAADGGDVASMRNLGHLLLRLQRPAEAAREFRRAASAGDEDSAINLRSLEEEANRASLAARKQLERLAFSGNERAMSMLDELRGQQSEITV